MSDFEKKILEFKSRLNSTQDSSEIELIRTDIFSKNGFINSQFKKLGSLSVDEKKTFASNINKAKEDEEKKSAHLLSTMILLFFLCF